MRESTQVVESARAQAAKAELSPWWWWEAKLEVCKVDAKENREIVGEHRRNHILASK